jgi:hypothetical protein
MIRLSNHKLHLLGFIISTIFILPSLLKAQGVGISDINIVADPSSILELRSTTQGVLIPRLTTLERDAIASPADGLLIFNSTSASFNYYNLGWQFLGDTGASDYSVIDGNSTITTNSTADVVITGMTLSPASGTYVVNFNSQCDIPDAVNTTGYNTSIPKADLNLIYTDIANMTATNTTHALSFGGGETLTPGVYSLAGAISLAGSITLDGGGDPNAVFVIRSTGGAFAAGASAIVNLTNGTKSSNVYWTAQGAGTIGASCIFHGTLISNTAAIAVGANCTISGRMLTKNGAVSYGPGTLSVPTNSSFIDFRSLTNFVIFSGSGGIGNTGGTIYTGDIGTDLGGITGFESATVNGSIYQPGSTTVVTSVSHTGTFSLYQNGNLITNSDRTVSSASIMSLHGIATVTSGEAIEVRWKIDGQPSDDGLITVSNRILSITKVQ